MSVFKMKKILATGVRFIESCIVDRLVDEGFRVRIMII